MLAKLRPTRDRVRKRDGKCEDRKSHAEERPETVALANRLHGMGYRAIGVELVKVGHVNESGKPLHHKSVRAMVGSFAQPRRRQGTAAASIRIEILERTTNSYEDRIIDHRGRTLCMFTYPTIGGAGNAARAWTAAYGDFPIVDKTGRS